MSVLDRATGWLGDWVSRGERETHPDYTELLLHDPRPQGEMSDMVLEAMQRTGREYWSIVGLLVVLALGGFLGAWVFMILTGLGVTGLSRPNYWGTFIASFI